MNTFISCGGIALTLSPAQCAQVARGLQVAAGDNDREAETLDLLANLFATAAIAATQQFYLPPSQNDALTEDLSALGLACAV